MPICSAPHGFFGGSRTLALAMVLSAASAGYSQGIPSGDLNRRTAEQHLQHGLHLGELYNWTDAEADFRLAEKSFSERRDKRNALYAHIGWIRATAQTRNLLQTSVELTRLLEEDPIVESDKKVRLLCLIVLGDIDQEIDSRAALLDWKLVKVAAEDLGNKIWSNRALGQIGISSFYGGDLATAGNNVATALAVAKQTHDVGAEIRFTTVLGLALSQAKMYEQALPYFETARRKAAEVPELGYPVLTNVSNLEALIGLHRFEEAQRSASEMLKQTKMLNAGVAEAEILPIAAQISIARGHIQPAIKDLQRSIAICRRRGYQQFQAGPYEILAQLFQKSGDFVTAEYYAGEAAKSAQASGDKWSLPERLQTLGQLQALQGKYREADRTFDKAGAFVDSALANSSTVLEKTALIRASGSLYPDQIGLLLLHLHNPAKAYTVIEQVRGRIATDLLMAGGKNPVAARRVERTISGLQLQMMSAKSAADVQQLREQIFSVQEERWTVPGISILKRKPHTTIPLAMLRQSLDSSTVLLEFVAAEPSSYCFVISRESFDVIRLAGGGKLTDMVDAFLRAVRAKQAAHVESRRLYAELLGPIQAIHGRRNLVIIPDGQLHRVPFDSLESASGTYVVDSHVVAYAPSATAYYLLQRETSHSGTSMRPLLAIGGVPYSQAGLRTISSEQPLSGPGLTNLPFSREEVLAADAALTGRNTLLLGQEATESALKHALDRAFGTLHIAAHAITDGPDPANAALALLPDHSAGEDGLFHASEIATMSVGVNLVVLSACDTGIGPIQGEEGVSTLANSFLLAGSKSVVSTLWPADDTASQTLMHEFYLGIASGEQPAVALAGAKRRFLQKFGAASVPYYWAGFTYEGVIGDRASAYERH